MPMLVRHKSIQRGSSSAAAQPKMPQSVCLGLDRLRLCLGLQLVAVVVVVVVVVVRRMRRSGPLTLCFAKPQKALASRPTAVQCLVQRLCCWLRL